MKILLVEDDEAIIEVLTRRLVAQHYVVDAVRDGEAGWTYSTTFDYDLILLDIVLPKLDGISLCQRLRAADYTLPILLLTAQDSSTTKVQGLDAGADDYVVKPFDHSELLARIRALMRRGSANPFPLLTWGELLLNPSTYEVSYDGQPLALTTKEYDLLDLFLRESQSVFSVSELIDRLWSSEEFPSEATVRSHLRRVRQKLTAVGAPPDFISTMHGRGYYLKSPEEESSTKRAEQEARRSLERSPAIEPGVERGETAHSSETQQQYVAFLNETWTTTQPRSLEQTQVLVEAIDALQFDRLSGSVQMNAQHVAHKLAGTLGVFGLTKMMHLSRQLEYWFSKQESLTSKHAPLMQTLVRGLQQNLQTTTQIEPSHLASSPELRLLLVSTSEELIESLMAVATAGSVYIETVATVEAALQSAEFSPSAILVHLPADSHLPAHSQSAALLTRSRRLELLELLSHRYPMLPTVAICERGELSDRVEILRRGGKLFLEARIPPEQILSAAIAGIESRTDSPKIMVVDDDAVWLSTLPTLLKPWGFKVTTLDDPQQFWTVLKAVSPDALILDVNMPLVNGFELCQILRSDPQWQRLPVLFVSVLTDAASQHQAFTVGGDDYLCKPVMGVELAHRILGRLNRIGGHFARRTAL